jgi:aromatic-amino-acid transaminase
MKEFVAKRSRQGVSKTDIIAINSQALKDAKSGNTVINASIGTFLDDGKKVGGVDLINEALNGHITEKMGYPNSYGDPEFNEGVMKYVFEDKLEKLRSLYCPFIGATLGGTGAVSIACNLFLEEGEIVLLPDVMWTNYKLIVKKAHAEFATYQMFDEKGGLNVSSIVESIHKARETSHHVLIVINDPCQNPTGYCMTSEEYDELFSVLNEEGRKGYLTVLFDIAYYSFFHVEGEKCVLIDKLTAEKTDFLPLIAFSGSKLFGLYGLRVGALIALCPNEINQDEVKRAFGSQARGVYSVPTGTVQHCVSLVLNDEEKIKELRTEVQRNSDILAERSKVLMEELSEAGIEYYPYKSGFFITLKIDNAFEIADELKKQHMYVVPMNENSIRLAISGMTKDEITTLIRAFAKLKK